MTLPSPPQVGDKILLQVYSGTPSMLRPAWDSARVVKVSPPWMQVQITTGARKYQYEMVMIANQGITWK